MHIRIFSQLCKKDVNKKITHVFLMFFLLIKCTPRIWVYLAFRARRKLPLVCDESESTCYNFIITSLPTNDYPSSKKIFFLYICLALSFFFLLRKFYVFNVCKGT